LIFDATCSGIIDKITSSSEQSNAVMESILSVQDEIHPIKPRPTKSSSHLSNNAHVKSETFDRTTSTSRTLVLYYQSLKTMLAERALYILGVLNLFLAAVAIVCVTQAEDHPEYFSLVYVAVSVFVFYMGTIVFIIVLQIVETYQEQHATHQSSSPVPRPTLTTPILIQSNPMIVESMTTTTQPKTRLSRSQTLPLTALSLHPQKTTSPSNSTSSSSTLKEQHSASPIQSIRLALLPKSHPSSTYAPRNYQAFALRTHPSLDASRTLTSPSDGDDDSHISPLIKPIPMTQPSSSDQHRSIMKMLPY
jgi:hypothetical protein